MRFIPIILSLLVVLPMYGQQSGTSVINIENFTHHSSESYFYKSSSGQIDTLIIAGVSTEYNLLYITAEVIGVINKEYFATFNDAVYSLIDVRWPYEGRTNSFLDTDAEKQLYRAFTGVFAKKEYRKMQRDLKKYLRGVVFGRVDKFAEQEGRKNTINDWLTLYGRDFFNIYIGMDSNNEVGLIYFRFQNIKFFRNLNPDRLYELERNILERITFKPTVLPPPENMVTLYLLSLDMNKLKDYYKNN